MDDVKRCLLGVLRPAVDETTAVDKLLTGTTVEDVLQLDFKDHWICSRYCSMGILRSPFFKMQSLKLQLLGKQCRTCSFDTPRTPFDQKHAISSRC